MNLSNIGVHVFPELYVAQHFVSLWLSVASYLIIEELSASVGCGVSLGYLFRVTEGYYPLGCSSVSVSGAGLYHFPKLICSLFT